MNSLVVLSASALGVALMVAIAAMLGFRGVARLDADALSRLAVAERSILVESIIDDRGRAAIAKLSDGRWLVARVVGDGVSARVFPHAGVRLSRFARGARVDVDDVGYPPLSLELSGALPAWLEGQCQ